MATQRLKTDPVARKILARDDTATRELDARALELNPATHLNTHKK